METILRKLNFNRENLHRVCGQTVFSFLYIGYNDCGGMEVFQPLLSSSLSVPLLSLGKTETHHKRVENILLEINLLSTFLRFSHMN